MKTFTCFFLFCLSLIACCFVNAQTFQWTWVSGDNFIQPAGIYGTKGVPSTSNKPGARNGAVSWRDQKGNLWLFGGLGRTTPTAGAGADLNDLWKYNPQTYEWTWVN